MYNDDIFNHNYNVFSIFDWLIGKLENIEGVINAEMKTYLTDANCNYVCAGC